MLSNYYIEEKGIFDSFLVRENEETWNEEDQRIIAYTDDDVLVITQYYTDSPDDREAIEWFTDGIEIAETIRKNI